MMRLMIAVARVLDDIVCIVILLIVPMCLLDLLGISKQMYIRKLSTEYKGE